MSSTVSRRSEVSTDVRCGTPWATGSTTISIRPSESTTCRKRSFVKQLQPAPARYSNNTLSFPDMNVDQYKIDRFVETHGLSADHQFRVLAEEVGELAEALSRDADDAHIAEEIADVIFVARSIASTRDINVTPRVNEVSEENLEKSTATEGDKVTKATDGGDGGAGDGPFPTFGTGYAGDFASNNHEAEDLLRQAADNALDDAGAPFHPDHLENVELDVGVSVRAVKRDDVASADADAEEVGGDD